MCQGWRDEGGGQRGLDIGPWSLDIGGFAIRKKNIDSGKTFLSFFLRQTLGKKTYRASFRNRTYVMCGLIWFCGLYVFISIVCLRLDDSRVVTESLFFEHGLYSSCLDVRVREMLVKVSKRVKIALIAKLC